MKNFNYFSKKHHKKSKPLNEITKYATLIFALMIFLSFFLVYIFYQNFNIGVYGYVSNFELLLYFIPIFIINPIKIIIMILNLKIFIPLFIIIICFVFVDTIILNKECSYCIEEIWKYLYEKILKYRKALYFLLIVYITFVLFFIITIYHKLLSFEGFSPACYENLRSFINTNGSCHCYFQILFFSWAIILLIWLYRFLKIKKKRKNQIVLYSIIFAVFILFIFESLKTAEKVASIQNGKDSTEVSFIYINDPINTDSNIVYIGQTKEYLFLRDLKENKNKIYGFSEIRKLIIKTNNNNNDTTKSCFDFY